MKTMVVSLMVIVAAVFLSCASLPPPQSDGNSLVVGYLVEDYPDGFFNLPPRTISQGLTLRFVNVTQNKRFTLKTNRGYFYFRSNGTDEYVLESYQVEVQAPDGSRKSTGSQLKWSFGAVADSVVYLGHVYIIRENPRQAAVAGAPRTLYWHFDTRVDTQWNDDSVREYIRSRDAGSEWLRYPLVRHGS